MNVSNIFLSIRDNHKILFQIIMFMITLVIIIYFFPRQAKFKYEFTKGKPWLHETIIAPFDLSILKSKEDVEIEKQIILDQHTPVFNYNSDIFTMIAEQYVDEFEEKWALDKGISKDKEFTFFNIFKQRVINNDSKKYTLVNYGYDLLKDIYAKGIIQLNVDFEYKPELKILLKRESLAEKLFINDFYSINSAANKINLSSNLSDSEYDFLVPILLSLLEHNVSYDKAASNKLLNYEINNINKTQGLIVAGQIIINKGELVNSENYQKLLSLKHQYEGKRWDVSSYYLVILGQFILVGLSLVILFLFLRQYRPYVIKDVRQVAMILFLVLIMVILTSLVINFNVNYLYMVPFCISPIILKAFFDNRVALFTYLISILIIGFIVPNGFEFIFLQLIAGIISILTVLRMYKRVQLFISAGKIILTYLLIYIAFAIIQEGSFSGIDLNMILQFTISGILTLFAYPFIFACEKIFGLVSDVSLLELTDTNSPLLRRLSDEAPGTFQHSLQVANLAEEGILLIGGNPLLVRAGAIYHDIGKLKNPIYFIENQSPNFNPHDDLSLEDSANIIINHVADGIELAQSYNLPDTLIEFIRTHHGDTTVQYFYNQFVNKFPDKEVDINNFTYPGPKPNSKETAVLMMADSSEAAARSLINPTVDEIDEIVEKVINDQINEKQFVNANITFKEITEIKKIFKEKLVNIHHARIQY